MTELDFDIVVLANNHRKALIVEYLQELPHLVHYSTDYELPPNWKPKPEYNHLVRHMFGHTGHHRALEGHKDALKMCSKNTILLFEDDAVPNRPDWLDVIRHCLPLLEQHEIISLHGRNVNFDAFNKQKFHANTFKYIPKTKTNYRYVLGCLAYLIKKESVDKFCQHTYDGLPDDLYICNNFDFVLIDPSPFDHDRSQGSLIDPPGTY